MSRSPGPASGHHEFASPPVAASEALHRRRVKWPSAGPAPSLLRTRPSRFPLRACSVSSSRDEEPRAARGSGFAKDFLHGRRLDASEALPHRLGPTRRGSRAIGPLLADIRARSTTRRAGSHQGRQRIIRNVKRMRFHAETCQRLILDCFESEDYSRRKAHGKRKPVFKPSGCADDPHRIARSCCPTSVLARAGEAIRFDRLYPGGSTISWRGCWRRSSAKSSDSRS